MGNKILYFGSGDFAVNPLKILLENNFEIEAVITQPDRIGGRGKKKLPTPVKEFALSKNLKVFQPENVNSPEIEDYIKRNEIKLNVVVAYGQILKNNIIYSPEYNSINLHPSLLPKYRGPSPIQNALINGEKETGVCIIEINEKLDAGDILDCKKVNVTEEDDYFTLSEKLSNLGGELLTSTIIKIFSGNIKKTPQNESEAVYCKKIVKSDGLINWQEPSEKIFNKIRALVKWPVCYSYHNGNLIKFYKAKILNEISELSPGSAVRLDKKNFGIVCGDKKILKIEKLQLQGKKILNVGDFLNGYKINTGDKFTDTP